MILGSSEGALSWVGLPLSHVRGAISQEALKVGGGRLSSGSPGPASPLPQQGDDLGRSGGGTFPSRGGRGPRLAVPGRPPQNQRRCPRGSRSARGSHGQTGTRPPHHKRGRVRAPGQNPCHSQRFVHSGFTAKRGLWGGCRSTNRLSRGARSPGRVATARALPQRPTSSRAGSGSPDIAFIYCFLWVFCLLFISTINLVYVHPDVTSVYDLILYLGFLS